MRDPKRIPGLIDKLEELWKRWPDMRLGQLVFVIQSVSYEQRGVFSIEDTELEEAMDKMLRELGSQDGQNLD